MSNGRNILETPFVSLNVQTLQGISIYRLGKLYNVKTCLVDLVGVFWLISGGVSLIAIGLGFDNFSS